MSFLRRIWSGKRDNRGSCEVKISGAVFHSTTEAKTIKICKSTVKDTNKRINYPEEYHTAEIHIYEVYLLWKSSNIMQLFQKSGWEMNPARNAPTTLPPLLFYQGKWPRYRLGNSPLRRQVCIWLSVALLSYILGTKLSPEVCWIWKKLGAF